MEPRRNILFVVAIDKYSSPDYTNLDNAVLDAKALEKVLIEKYDFELYVESLYDAKATKENIYNALNSLVASIEEEDNLIIYFAGHGQMHPLTNKGYWVPADATNKVDTLIENSVIKDYVESIKAKHIWVVADSCFSGTFLSRTRGYLKELPYYKLDANASRWMLASGNEEKVSDGPKGQGSPFSKYLIRFLNENINIYTSVSEVIKYVTILTAANSMQTPRGSFIDNVGHSDGEMVLILNEKYVELKSDRTNGTPNTPKLRRELRANQKKEKLSAGKEILFVKSFVDNADYLILENFRFDDDGNKKMTFENEKVILSNGEIFVTELIQRFATWSGFNRYIKRNELKFKNRRIAAVYAREDIEYIEETEISIEYADYLHDLMSYNKDIMVCLHCGERISTNDSYLVEIDEKKLKNNVGNVHNECLRPADRVIGSMGYEGLVDEVPLTNFDFKKWSDLLERGHGQLRAFAKKLPFEKTALLLWNSDHIINIGNYCIQMVFEDGSSSMMKLGKNIHRFKANEIDYEVKSLNAGIEKCILENDPMCKIDGKNVHGNFQQLSKVINAGEKLLKLSYVEKVRYSDQLEDNTEKLDNDYTPLAIAVDVDSGDYIKIYNTILLISDPSQFTKFYNNWKAADKYLGRCSLKIINSDVELDIYLRDFFEDGIRVVIDPLFNEKKEELIYGLVITDIDDLKKAAVLSRANLSAGDNVKIVFPDVKTEKYATGTMLTDPFVDEKGEVCFIFQPYEDGKPLEEQQYKMPLHLAHKIEIGES